MSDANEPRNLALRRIAAREYSRAEMVAYLKRKGVETKQAEEVVARLVEESLISDERYAKVVARHQATRGKGPAYVRMKLKQKGIHADASEVREMLGDVTGESDIERARKIVEARYPNAANDKTVAAKAYQALIRRGFSFDVARAVLFRSSRDRDNET